MSHCAHISSEPRCICTNPARRRLVGTISAWLVLVLAFGVQSTQLDAQIVAQDATVLMQAQDAMSDQGTAAACVDGQACTTDADCSPGACLFNACVCKCAPPGDDCFTTQCNGNTHVDFSFNPIPADYFFPGSPPFAGTVNLGGPGAFPADTTVRRLQSMCFPGPLPETVGPIPIELVQLNLVSCSPIDVSGISYDMHVGLDPIAPSLGDLTATKENDDGGTFSSNLNINAVIWFEPAGGGAPTADILMNFVLSSSGGPWSQVDPGTFCNASGFFPGWITGGGTQPCCEEICHDNPQGDHPHCVQPPDCPKCPTLPDPCPPPDPLNDLCANLAATQCIIDPIQDEECRLIGVGVDANGQGIAEICTCLSPGDKCGPIELDPSGDSVFCPGACTMPNVPGLCEIFADFNDGTGPQPWGVSSAPTSSFPQGTTLTCDCPGGAPDPDPHKTVDPTILNFGQVDSPAIPADFFDPGSAPFVGAVDLTGDGDFGDADTLVQRMAQIPPMTQGDSRTVDIEIVALNLVSVDPITVTTGTSSEAWDLRVTLTDIGSSGLDGLTATKTHANGGTYDAHMPVLPKLTFTRVSDPLDVRVLDYGVEGLPPIQINIIAAPWVINLDESLQGLVLAPSNGNFVPGIEHEDIGGVVTQTVVPVTGQSKGGGVGHTVTPITFCPIPGDPAIDPCAGLQQTQCVGSTLDLCLLKAVQVGQTGTPPDPIECACFTDGPGCGALDIDPLTGAISCPGDCVAPDAPPCQIWVTDATGTFASGMVSAPAGTFPPGSILFCDCAPPCTNDQDCDDGNQCTTDVCNADGTCVNTPDCLTATDCDDGNACTTDACDANGCCINRLDCTTDADCDDGDSCTADSCDALTGCCSNDPLCTSNADCDDGNVCTTDTCLAVGCCDNTPDCQTNADCADTDPCTIDTCDAAGCCHNDPDPICGPCEPLADGSDCSSVICPDVNDECQPRCVNYDPLTGAVIVVDCECRGLDECHVEKAAATGGQARPVGDPCIVPDDAAGTVTLPPIGCDYLSPEEVHEIMDAAGSGVTFDLAPIHKDFICGERKVDLPGCPPDFCEEPGGDLSGNVDCFESTLELNVSSPSLPGFNRTLFVPGLVRVDTGPRTPGDAVQDFDTEMVQLQGEIFGDPDFCTFRIVAGTANGLPSPGHTTLTRLGPPGSNFSVDSFFDITYSIEFQGCPGSAIEGMGGTSVGTIRMQTGSKPTCVGGCPAGEICEETQTTQADGTIDICCDCRVPTGACCLPGGGCVVTTATNCQLQGGIYRGDGTNCDDNNGDGVPDECEQDICQPSADGQSCVGPCPEEECWGECIDGAYCDNPLCCVVPGSCVCYAPTHAVSIDRCGSGGAIPPTQECNARCATVDPLTGAITVTDCDCTGLGDCHVDLPAAQAGVASLPPGGDPCVVPDDAGGTVTLPPAGCDYLSADEVHAIMDTLGSGVTFELAPIHKDFICERGDLPGCPPPGTCEEPGGGLGGNVDCFESTLELAVTSPELPGFSRTLFIPAAVRVDTGPRTPGDAVQSFPTEMVAMQGELFGDPDFCVLTLTAGDSNGLPSPGQTTLTQLPSGDFAVDSFFDITYRIDFQGCPGSALEGMGGTHIGNIRMQTGTTPDCVGTCPANTSCLQTKTVNADGSIEVCCTCEADCLPVNPPATPAGEAGFDKNRYISFDPTNGTRQVAYRVTLPGCANPLWIGPPARTSEASGVSGPPAGAGAWMWASNLSATPHCTDWSPYGTVHTSGDEIIPGTSYDIQAVPCDCDMADPANHSAPLNIPTATWGDLGADCGPCPCGAPDLDVDFDDISMLVDKFRNLPCAPIKARTDVAPDQPDRKIDFIDIPAVVDAFRGLPYPFVIPPCP